MPQVLTPLPGAYAICRLDAAATAPPPAEPADLWSLTRTAGELSLVCRAHDAPPEALVDAPWCALRLEGPFDLQGETGIIASVAAPLADARISVFAMATYDTDYVLVPATRAAHARRALTAAGHTVATRSTAIRPGAADDAPGVGRLVHESLLAYRAFAEPDFDPAANPATDPENIAERYGRDGAIAFVAHEDEGDAVVGAVGMITTDEPGLGHVWQVFVDPAHQGTGLAARLHDDLVVAARLAGRTTLRLYVATGATAARAFYAAHGWRESPDDEPGPPGLPVTRFLRDL